nr:Arm DNA-binding domain-containing protein [Sphingobium sp. OAS761]
MSDRYGSYLVVKPSKSRLRRMIYHFHHCQRTITFGRYPKILLADAGERLLQARCLPADGIDPADQAKLNKMADAGAALNSFSFIAL